MPSISPERKEIGNRLRAARESSGVPAETLAKEVGRTVQAYYHWETGNAMPTVDQLRILCRLMEVSADFILSGVAQWPFELFQPEDYARLSDVERKDIENAIAGAIQRAKKPIRPKPIDQTKLAA